LYLNDRPTTRENLTTYVRAEVEANADVQVLIAADSELPYGEVVALIDLMKESGVRRYALNVAYKDRQ
jgi:biopolymer transport protein ExbD